ncbi:unnamed protein product (macronuclear) [Paramecium tetraurelia]|uniref:Serine/threonine-protein phosphatase 4 regulatory subunit 3-like central domain-containing protein n=1 Tax=Paramecium tetraurelia TaxID=5888 RepID=A0CLG8_PARTE|nr:uncharacterized protein GSPATT00008183001 [Paramecium tetraurelia]CAK71635.1 unnamed protein product [Paramecium tetraurelia]|eukprot:XP_001439032.1 hypothetical protein (macronuclear) [Paramecium tetraurelia strain d4-2]
MFLNFGRFFGFGSQSKFDILLKQDNLTLETILNEEDILSELKNSSSGKFADFIIQHPKEYYKMIYYINKDVTDQEYNSKYPFLISEILGSENDKLINFLFEKQEDTPQEEVQNPLEDQLALSQFQEEHQENEKLRQNLLPDLLSLLENDFLLITLAGYFTKIISAIIHKRGDDFWEYLKNHPRIISNLFKHLSIRQITEIFEKLIILDKGYEEHHEGFYIEERQNLIARMLKFLKGESHSNTIITNICESLIEVYKRALISLESMVVLREILLKIEKPLFFMSLALQTQNSSIYSLLNIQFEFYNKMSQLQDKPYEIELSVLYKPILDESLKALTQQDIFKVSFQTTSGNIIRPLGDSKLLLIQLIIQLIQKKELALVIENGEIFQQIINLVFEYQTNNQLHVLFEKLIVAILDSQNDHLHELFFEDTNFLNLLIKINGSEERKKKHGFQGILTKITNYINTPSVLQKCQVVQTAIDSIQNEWLKYLEELQVVNEVEQSWLLGVNPRFREQINVDPYSPPIFWPNNLSSYQNNSTDNSNSQTNENQEETQVETNNTSEKQEIDQNADEFDSEEAQIEKQSPIEVVQVKEENIESLDEQQPEKYEQKIVDSPVYVVSDEQIKENPVQIAEFQEEPNQSVQEEQDIVQQEEQLNDQNQNQQNQLQEQPKQEEQSNTQEQPKQDEQQDLLQEQPKKEGQQQPQVEQEPQVDNNAIQEQQEQDQQLKDNV